MPSDRAPDTSAIDAPEATVPTGTVASAVAAGIAFDIAFNGQRPGIAIPLFVGIVAVAMHRLAPRSPHRDVLLAGAALFAAFPAVRASERLIAADLLVVTALLSLAAGGGEPIARASLLRLGARAIRAWATVARVPASIIRPLAAVSHRLDGSRVRTAVRAVAIGVPVIVVFAVLLATADRVFADILIPDLPVLDAADIAGHLTMVLLGTVLLATLFLSAAARTTPDEGVGRAPRPSRVRPPEWTTVLAGIDVLFVLFVIVQFAFLFGGRQRVLVTPRLTYAEYARSGFFQLIAVAALTVVVILGAWDLGERRTERHERTFRTLVSIAVALAGVILASALSRLALYEETFGFTMNRLLAYSAIGWVGFVLVAALAAIWWHERERVVPVALAGALAALLVLNLMDAERFVAERNAARFERTGKIDVDYLTRELGPDATPVVAGLAGLLGRGDARIVRASLCARRAELEAEPGIRSWNAARSRARDALSQAGITREACGDA